jgi:flagellar hook-associated protein 1 FlgK
MTVRSLYAGLSALRAQSRRLEVTQQNTANAATPGYRRQEVDLRSVAGDRRNASLFGVSAGPRRSVLDPFVDRQVTHRRGAAAYENEIASSYRSAEAVFDPLGSEGINLQLSALTSSLRRLSAFPAGQPERRDVISQAEGLASELRRARSAMVDTARGLEDSAGDLVGRLNRELQEIAELDRAIQRERARSGGQEGDLVDRRDTIAAQVAETLDARIARRIDGTLHLSTPEGATLVEGGKARTVEVQREGSELVVRVASGELRQRLGRPGGRLGAKVEVHNEVLRERVGTLDQLAFDLGTGLNAIHETSFGVDGSTGRPFFTVGPLVEGAAQTLSVDPLLLANSDGLAMSSDPLLTGNNDGLVAMLSFLDGPLSTGRSAGEVARGMVQAIGTRIADAERRAENLGLALGQLQALQDSVSGVSLEEEFVRLIETQRAFEAALKVITTADEMLQTVLSIKR